MGQLYLSNKITSIDFASLAPKNCFARNDKGIKMFATKQGLKD